MVLIQSEGWTWVADPGWVDPEPSRKNRIRHNNIHKTKIKHVILLGRKFKGVEWMLRPESTFSKYGSKSDHGYAYHPDSAEYPILSCGTEYASIQFIVKP